jgi:hypothetical protein
VLGFLSKQKSAQQLMRSEKVHSFGLFGQIKKEWPREMLFFCRFLCKMIYGLGNVVFGGEILLQEAIFFVQDPFGNMQICYFFFDSSH